METLVAIRELLMRTEFVALPFFVCISFLLLFERLAPKVGFVDRPDMRKNHVGEVPLVGGPAMFFAIATNIIILVPQTITGIFLLLASALVVLGMLDDKLDMPVRIRVPVQLAVAILMFGYGGVQITEIGNLIGMGEVEFYGTISLLFTVVCIFGVINSINMIDGVDGLAGSILLLSFLGIARLAWVAGDALSAQVLVIFIGALLAFLCFNARIFVARAQVFMGDSGSMLMGFALAWFFITMTQGESPSISAVNAGWIFGLPLADTVAVMARRLVQGRSPLVAGRDHLHHALLDAGFSVNGTLAIMLGVHAVFVTTGVLTNGMAGMEPVLFLGFVATVILHFFVTPRILDSRMGKASPA